MKTYISGPKNIMILLGVMLSFTLFTACEKDGQGGNPKPAPGCATTGTFTRILCGVSVYDNYWIQLDNAGGQFLQPCETMVANKMPLNISDGTRIRFNYSKITGKSSCDNMVTCMAVDPRVKSSAKVKITCLEILADPIQCLYIGVVQYNDKCKTKLIQKDNGGMYEPINQDQMSAFSVNDKIKFNYAPVYTLKVTCSGAAPIDLTCAQKMQALPDPKPVTCRPLQIGTDPKVPPTNGAQVSVLSAFIEGNCLVMKIGFSGCSDHSGKINLMWDGYITKTNPSSVSVQLLDTQPEMCQAYFTQQVSYDLSAIRKITQQTVIVNLGGWKEQLKY